MRADAETSDESGAEPAIVIPPRSVIATLLVHDNLWSALRAIRGVRAQTTPVERLIIVDNGSPTPLLGDLHRAGEQLAANEVVIRSPSNRGVGAGHNIAIEAARRAGCGLVWFLEQDTFVDPDCLAALLELHPGADEVAIPLLARNEYERVDLDRQPPVYGGSLRSTEHDHLVTFNGIVVSLDLIDRVGALREDFHIGLEDRDFARRVAALGGRLVVSRRVLGIHPTRGNGRFPEPTAPERVYYSVRNQFISGREIGVRPGVRPVARVLGAASRAVVTGDAASATARLRGLRDGLGTPIGQGTALLGTRIVARSGPSSPQPSALRWVCRLCGRTTSGRVFPVASRRALPERVCFRYGECGLCESLTLLDGIDPSDYYGDGYERLAPRSTDIAHQWFRSVIGSAFRRARSIEPLSGRGLLDRFAPSWYGWFRGVRLTRRTPILDVGCGNGALLFHLQSFGFENLLGIDPFLLSAHVEPGLRLERLHLDQVSGRFTIISFNHSLEHVDDPGALLELARSRLEPDGAIVVQVPITGGAAWRRYRDNLVSLDAPLHRFIPTPEGIAQLARRHQLGVARWNGATTPYYYRWSELVRIGAPCDRIVSDDARRQRWANKMARRERGSDAAQASFVLAVS